MRKFSWVMKICEMIWGWLWLWHICQDSLHCILKSYEFHDLYFTPQQKNKSLNEHWLLISRLALPAVKLLPVISQVWKKHIMYWIWWELTPHHIPHHFFFFFFFGHNWFNFHILLTSRSVKSLFQGHCHILHTILTCMSIWF